MIRRADPALQQTDKVLATLAEQNKQLAQLAEDSDTILAPLAAQRQHLAGFIRNAAIAGSAAAERRDDIVAGFDEFPNALRELQQHDGRAARASPSRRRRSPSTCARRRPA